MEALIKLDPDPSQEAAIRLDSEAGQEVVFATMVVASEPPEPVPDYMDLIYPLTDYLLTLTPTQLTTMYCEICNQRMGAILIEQIGNPFHENQGVCCKCGNLDEVSNPLINRFLNEKGITLEGDWTQGRDQADNNYWAVMRVMRNWLIPYDYYCAHDPWDRLKQTPAEAWVTYGRKAEKKAYKVSWLSDAHKALLTEFFPLCYSLDRFNTNPIRQDKQSKLPLLEQPSKPNLYKGWLERAWALFNGPVKSVNQ